jgi:hypothetical protein
VCGGNAGDCGLQLRTVKSSLNPATQQKSACLLLLQPPVRNNTMTKFRESKAEHRNFDVNRLAYDALFLYENLELPSKCA